MEGKFVKLSNETHREIKVLAAETGRRISGDLLEEIARLGLREVRKNFARSLTRAGQAADAQGVTA